MITIIDYKSGNLKSISNGFKKIGCDVEITSSIEKIADSDYLVLPGVGAFGSAMENLEEFKKVIHEHVDSDKAFLGICLGQQVLMDSSEESPNVEGLKLYGRSDRHTESCTSVSAELLQPGRKRCEGETRTADSRKK